MSTRYGGTGGAIVNVSSGASRMGSPGEYIDYAATKGALDTLTLGLAREVATEGIRVNAVLAGHIYTELHASGGEPNRVERVKSQVPMGRGGPARGSGAGDPVAALRRGLLHDGRARSTSPAANDAAPAIDDRAPAAADRRGAATRAAAARLMTPAVSQWLASWPSPLDEAGGRGRLRQMRDAAAAGTRRCCFAIERREDGALIGSVMIVRSQVRRPARRPRLLARRAVSIARAT